MRVLIVEDDPALAGVLREGLAEHDIQSVVAGTFDDGLLHGASSALDVILLDVLLPGGSGFDLCRRLRQKGVTTPIIMLTAKDAVDDRVLGLEAGADDYLTKPFAFRELLARIRAVVRRPPALAPEVMRVADLEVDLGRRTVRRGRQEIRLTAKEFSLLEFFVRHAGQVVDRAAITAHVWDENHDPFTNVLEVLVRRLRRKIDDDYDPKLIQTLRGAGYRFGA
ncbi:MAG: response regulator transcription factor [Gemmatimonadales bacterium]|jgi:two-component system copper resistance phosphate regulon response regulator CusR